MKPQAEQPQKCPRCDSLNTKFCYYNNYSLTQPRYFCKTCRRYWTKGGTLRNVPVGGGCRKGKRSNRGGSSDHSISSSFQDKQVTATTSSPGRREGMIGTGGEDGHVPAAPVYYSGDHGGFNNYSAATAARVQLHMIDQQASSSGGDDNKLSILPSLAALQSFNHATNLGDFSSIFYPRGHHHHLPTTPPTETFQTPPLFNLPVVQGLNNGSNHWRLQQEHTNFSPPAAAAAAATGQQQHRPLDAHIGRDGPLHLLPVDENVFPGLRNHQKLVHHVSTTATAGAPYSSVKPEETTGVSRQDWQVQSESHLENATNPCEGVTTAAATGYWNNGCSSSSGPSPHWPDLSGYGPPSSFL